MTTRLPTTYVPHGGGPWPWMADLFGQPASAMDELRAYLASLPASLPQPPKAILCISAHWEARQPTVSSAARPPMLYDYQGFPANTYQVQWPAPGDPGLADRVMALLSAAGFDPAADPRRGFDHGTFVPLAVAWPDADVPTVQLSLMTGLDPARHIAVGRALAPLRDQGVFILGSGMSYHAMSGFRTDKGAADADTFDDWLQATVRSPPTARDASLTAWAQAPAGRASHPREEHLIPLMVIAGAAGDDQAEVDFSAPVLGTRVSGVRFG